MSFVIDDAYLPATLTAKPMTDNEFASLCAEHPDLLFEMTAEGELIVMPPTHSITGARNSELTGQLSAWARHNRRGISCDSSSGFVLPNGARRSPDASWVLKSRIKQLKTSEQEDNFWHLCPDFVIELQSKTDRPRPLNEKMLEYIANGAQLGWLINPAKRAVTVYRSSAEPETLTNIDSIQGEDPVGTFTLDLTFIWNPLA